MKKIVLLVIIVFLIVLPLLPSNEIEKKIPVSPGEELTVNLKSGGSIAVMGRDADLVMVRAKMKKNNLKDWNFDILKTSSGVEVVSRFLGPKINFFAPILEIEVPIKFDLKLKTLGGDIKVEMVEGDLSGRTMGGNLTLLKLKGQVNMKTMGGQITLKDSQVDGKVKSYGGRVIIENVTGDVKGSSLSGNVIYKNLNPSESGEGEKVVHISTMGGGINVSEAPYGANVHTMNGNIHLLSVKKFVKAKTLNGDILLDSAEGQIKAVTLNGKIRTYVPVVLGPGEQDMEFNAVNGEIYLEVPGGLSMDLEVELVYTRNSVGKYSITSDFELKKTESEEWNCSRGTPRKSIFGKAVFSGGKNKIKIKAIKGNIIIKKKK